MQSAEDFVRESKYPETAFIALIRARDAEWQARVDALTAALKICHEAMAESERRIFAALGREA